MRQHRKLFELKNTAKDKLEGKYGVTIRLFLLNMLITGVVHLIINSVGSNTINSIYSMTGSSSAATGMSFVFDALLLLADIILGVMNAGISLYFLKIACGESFLVKDLFYGYKTDSKKILLISGAVVLCQTLCLGPFQYLCGTYLRTREEKWLLYALAAAAIGLCIYVPVSLGIAMSFYLALDFPQSTGREILIRCWHIMKGQRGRLFCLELSFLPLMFLCVLSFGIGFLWLMPYMQMTYTYFFLDLMTPEKTA